MPIRYRVTFTVEARETYDRLSQETQDRIDHALRVLARDPRHKGATAPRGADDNSRKAYVSPGVMLEYVISEDVMIVVVVEVFAEELYLSDIPEPE
jgi:mRNA-degrading endonuclease RelE of RelBE toxin-antitoxin system